MKIVAITGGIGVGKTTVCNFFKSFGASVYHSDLAAKEIMVSDLVLKNAIQTLLGKDAYLKEGSLNKSYIASEIFGDPEKRKALNKLVHPAVNNDFEKWLSVESLKPHRLNYVIYESALVFENKKEDAFDVLILVTAPLDERIKRVVGRDAKSKSQVSAVIKAQFSDDKNAKKADFLIDNQDLSKTLLKTKEIHNILIK
ncbi:MAG: dephospho-CoA kinase [Flavobacteriaceae bacterium]|nr:dephospho-CoA kinase [Flavobacteriaceae bacterium]